jgi:hypothetical protein
MDLQEGSCDKTQQADIASYKGISLGFFLRLFPFLFFASALLHYTARPNALKSRIFD